MKSSFVRGSHSMLTTDGPHHLPPPPTQPSMIYCNDVSPPVPLTENVYYNIDHKTAAFPIRPRAATTISERAPKICEDQLPRSSHSFDSSLSPPNAATLSSRSEPLDRRAVSECNTSLHLTPPDTYAVVDPSVIKKKNLRKKN